MTSPPPGRSRWRDIEQVCQAALAEAPSRRAAVLDELCAGDPELRREVEAFLAQASRTDGFLQAPALADAAGALGSHGEPRPPDPDETPSLLPEGTRLGPYELLAPIGAGGMGTVYEARDTRLDRRVAVKVLPPGFASDPDRRARFAREAKTIAGLNHPHICILHDTGDAIPSNPDSGIPSPGSVSYLVMEHLTGETLATRLQQGPLPVPRACALGAQIADALAAAHRHGIIHRDLKPANVMLTPGGPGSAGLPHVKLLDFGLAKLTGHGEHSLVSRDGAQATDTSSFTARGTIFGTLPYMAPEQLEGKPTDARTDLWALGCVLYEMLTGTRAFTGDSAVTLMGRILTSEPPPLPAGPPAAPPALDRLVRTCLAKAPDDRWDSAHDIADELRWIRDSPASGPVPAPASARRPSRARTALQALAIAMLLSGTAIVTWWASRPPPAPSLAQHYLLDTRPADGLGGAMAAERTYGLGRPSRTAIAVSPDGTVLVFAGVRDGHVRLYRRRIDEDEAVPVEGTEEADSPVFSPDGVWLGFWARGRLWKVRLAGGLPVPICDAGHVAGLSWSSTGLMAFGLVSESALFTVPAAGGTPVRIQTGSSESAAYAYLPHFLPDGETLLFSQIPGDPRRGSIHALSRRTAEPTLVMDGAVDGRFVPPGYLVYVRDGRLEAAPFDASRLAVTGESVPLTSGIMQAANAYSDLLDIGAAQFTCSDTGTLMFVSGGTVPDKPMDLVWVDRRGHLLTTIEVPAGPHFQPRVSPDGRRVAYVGTGTSSSLWVYDMARGVASVIPAVGLAPSFPTWSPDSTTIAFGAFRSPAVGDTSLHISRVDGSLASTALEGDVPRGTSEVPASWAPDGALLYVRIRAGGKASIWRLQSVGSTAEREPLLEGVPAGAGRQTVDYSWPAASPDGSLLAYVEMSQDGPVVCVRGYPDLGNRQQLSARGGVAPQWRGDGRELYYISTGEEPRALMAVASDAREGGAWGAPRRLFALPPDFHVGSSHVAAYAVSADGQRFLFVRRERVSAPPPPSQIHVILGWNRRP